MKYFLWLLLAFIFMMSFKSVAHGQQYWRHEDASIYISAFSYADSNNIVAASSNNGIFKSIDGGKNWKQVYEMKYVPGNYAKVSNVAHPNARTIFATVDSSRRVEHSGEIDILFSSTVLRSEDSGATWVENKFGQLGDVGERVFKQIIMNDSLNGLIAQMWTDTNRNDRLAPILFTTDGGITWNNAALPKNNFVVAKNYYQDQKPLSSPAPGIWFLQVYSYYTDKYELWYTGNFGKTWSEVMYPIENVHKIVFLDSNKGFAIGYRNLEGNKPLPTIAKTTDGGKKWTISEFPSDRYYWKFTDIDFYDIANGLVAEYGVIFRTTDSGATWNEEYVGLIDSTEKMGGSLMQLSFLSKNSIMGISDSYNIIRYIPEGIAEQPHMTVPKIVGPIGANVENFAVPGKMWWYSITGAEKYYVQIVKGESSFWTTNTDYILNDSTTTNSIAISDSIYKSGLQSYEYYYTVRVRSANSNSVSNWSVPVPFRIVKGITHILDHQEYVENPYPNPANNIIYIPFKTTNESEISVMISNALGKSINIFKSSYSLSHNAIMLSDLEQLSNGIYFVQISQGNQQQTSMITISK